MRVSYIFIVCFFVLNYTFLFADLDGIYKISVSDRAGKKLASASSFIVDRGDKKLVVSSYHLLEEFLLDADKISLDIDGLDLELRIVSVDEFHDILILSPEYYSIDDLESFKLKKSCEINSNIVGYRKNKQFLVSVDNVKSTKISGFSRIKKYLPAGFSGAPIIDSSARYVCGMLLLSSKRDSSSVSVNSSVIIKQLEKKQASLSVEEYRLSEGLEYIVRNNSELKESIKNAKGRQVIVNIIGLDKFVVSKAKNLIVNVLRKGLPGLIVKNSQNILISGISGSRLMVKDSKEITVANSYFYGKNFGIILDNSKDLLIANNQFYRIENAIVLENISNIDSIFVKGNQFVDVNKHFLRNG